ncbi:HIT domain-containing protein [Methanotrichaceae archaeon Mx]|uniref:HIT domain-containing protein n=1 Tax=Candidatus Methanocrinis natronophilus TaxID=3033396 RepID=A0ABT5X6L4_9EURY|nr:HIT domain-containing protein [Candidatus Methanocrinis natronophilus]MDF0590321.1 HIT domain-containing protein [Candidatus Methanocrinis natronophilus]
MMDETAVGEEMGGERKGWGGGEPVRTLWAPWRMDYILSDKRGGCIFCEKEGEDRDRENLILFRGRHHFIIMNAYPYNNGHMMVVPRRHTSTLEGWSPEERAEFLELTDIAVDILKRTMRPDGFNIGINMGEVAGAGIADHIHLHVVPRWSGDCNFMPVLADTRVVPEHIQATYEKLLEALDEVS